jgi:hypothetical protein
MNEQELIDKTGGPAFPSVHAYHAYVGMTLRDWFAGQALAGLVGKIGSEKEWSLVGEYCYNAADKLIATRDKSKGDIP